MPAAGDGFDAGVVRQRLEDEATRLAALLAGERPDSGRPAAGGELADIDQHPADQASETAARSAEIGEATAVAGELQDVQAALTRLDQGTYGRCVACGRPIGPDRLDALPATPYCVEDAYLAERDAMRGD